MAEYIIRVYGLWIRDGHVLASDEIYKGHRMTKFPGGGLEPGEGLADCLKREFREELGFIPDIFSHFYTTDFFQESAFHPGKQLISIYYTVESAHPVTTVNTPFEGLQGEHDQEIFRWRKITELDPEEFTYPTDQRVAMLLKAQYTKD